MKFKAIFFLTLFPLMTWADDHAAGVNAETSLRWLKNGNQRFVSHKLRNDGQSSQDVQRLSTGQKPHAIILSCSDSRVPPEILFDQKLGEIFVVRTAGEALGDNVIGSIEYAVEHLGSKLIVVMGHTSCGAVKAAHGSLAGTSVGTPALDNLVKDIHPRLASFKGKAASTRFEQESWANAKGVAEDLEKRSKLIAEKIHKGDIQIVSSLYDLDSGTVTFQDKTPENLSRSLASEAKAVPAHVAPAAGHDSAPAHDH